MPVANPARPSVLLSSSHPPLPQARPSPRQRTPPHGAHQVAVHSHRPPLHARCWPAAPGITTRRPQVGELVPCQQPRLCPPDRCRRGQRSEGGTQRADPAGGLGAGRGSWAEGGSGGGRRRGRGAGAGLFLGPRVGFRGGLSLDQGCACAGTSVYLVFVHVSIDS